MLWAFEDLDSAAIQLLRQSTRSISLDETVDLTAPGTEAFRAFKTDRIFRFTLNGHGYEWGMRKITEPELRLIGHVHDDEAIFLEREGEDIDLKPDGVVDLGKAGTEHLHTEKRLITVYFENEPREIPCGAYTTAPTTNARIPGSQDFSTIGDGRIGMPNTRAKMDVTISEKTTGCNCVRLTCRKKSAGELRCNGRTSSFRH